MLEVKIQIKGSAKEYTLEVEDKSEFINEIKSVIENDSIFEFSDDKGEYGIVGSAIASIAFIDSKGDKKAGF